MVNPFSVKKIKELDDNSPKKTDIKDPKTIAKLVVDGRYSIPYMPEGVYAEIRDLVYSRDRIVKQHNISANRIQRWLAIHFPEYLGIYTRFDAASGLAVLENAAKRCCYRLRDSLYSVGFIPKVCLNDLLK